MAILHSAPHRALQSNRAGVSKPPAPAGILVVDDDELARSVLGQFFRQYEIPVWLASDGEEAVEIYERFADEIGVVLVDANLADLDGPRLVSRLKERDNNVIGYFMAEQGEPSPARSLRATSIRTLLKPLILTALSAHVQRSLARRDTFADLTRVAPLAKPYLDNMAGELVRFCQTRAAKAVPDETAILSWPA